MKEYTEADIAWLLDLAQKAKDDPTRPMGPWFTITAARKFERNFKPQDAINLLTALSSTKRDLESVYETLVIVCDFLEIDLAQAQKATGKPSDVFIAAIKEYASKNKG